MTCTSCKRRTPLNDSKDEITISKGKGGFGAFILTDIMPQNVLDLLLLELATDNETTGTVHRASCTQFGEQVLDRVLRWSMHTLADIGNVCEHRLLVSFSGNAGRSNDVSFARVGEEGGVGSMELAVETS